MPEQALTVSELVKRYDQVTAVDHLSFSIERGELFGLLGPNGAGKTSTIRALMGIVPPDEGTVRLLGGAPKQVRGRVGYLPEERGLYAKQRLLEVLVFLAQLKGLDADTAHENAMRWLERVDLQDRAQDKISELSRGMQQKAQLVATLVHDPDLIILDEPFQGLDPVNVNLVKEILRELQSRGKTIALSSHQMNLVEELCDRIVLINHGRAVLYGPLSEIKRKYAERTVRLRTGVGTEALQATLGGDNVEHRNGVDIVHLADWEPSDLLRRLLDAGIEVLSYEVATAPLQDIFVAAVQAEAA